MAARALIQTPGLARFAKRGDLGNLVLATLAINVLSLALPVMTLQVYDRILPNPGSGTIPALVVGVSVAVGLEIALRYSRAYLLAWNGAAFEHRASCEAVTRVLGADLSKLDARGVGEQLHRLNAIGKLREIYSGAVLTTFIELAFVGVFLVLIAHLASWLVLAPICVLGLFVAHALAAGHRLKAALDDRDRIDDERYNFLIETLEGVHTVKAFALEQEFERRYEHFEKRSSAASYTVTEQASGAFNTGMVFSHVMIAVVIVVGAFLTIDGVITSGALVASVLLSGRIMQPVQRALALWARYQDVALAGVRARELMSTPQAANSNIDGPTTLAAPPRLGRVALEGVSFRYGDDEPWLIRDVDLSLQIGEAVSIVGPNGAGKSTLLKVVAGLLPATEGEVLVDGVPVASIPPAERVAHVGMLTTDAAIFRGSLRDNITRFGLTPERNAREIAALLGLDKDVAKLPAGFDTHLEGNALDPIPPGLRQRIAIARALAPKPRVIIFDAADKALDRTGYAHIFDVLARLREKTALIIVSEDENIRSLATQRRRLVDGRLETLAAGRPDIAAAGYRSLQL